VTTIATPRFGGGQSVRLSVFVVENGKAFFHMVRTGAVMGDMVEVQSGLALGEQIVVNNNEEMLNGDIIESADAENAAKGA